MDKAFKDILKELRLEKNISQLQLANAIQVSNGVICFWETGKNEPKLTYIKRLALYFHVSSDYLIGLEADDGTKMYDDWVYISSEAKNSGVQGEGSELEKIFKSLTPEQQENLLNYARGMDASNDILKGEKSSKKSDIA